MKLAAVLTASILAACSQSSPPATRALAAPAVTDELDSAPSASVEGEDGCLALADANPDASVTVEGTLFVDEAFTHPNGTRTRPFVLRLDAPRCVAGGTADVREIHVGAVEGVELRPWVGRRVKVSGAAIPAMTAWHARDVVLLASRATRGTGGADGSGR